MVLVADEITPSVIAQLDWSKLAALVTDAGSWTYHTAILARSLRIPAVAGLHNASSVIPPGTNLAVDGSTGEVITDPDEQALQQIAARRRRREAYELSLDEFRPLPAVTVDGVAIRLEANIETPDDASRAGERGAEGIGLFRSEFLLAGGGQSALAEEAQFVAYRRLLEGAAGRRVTVRTFDVSEPQLPIEHAGVEGHPGAARTARHPPQPGARRNLPGAAARPAARRRARPAARHVPVRLRPRRTARGAQRRGAGGGNAARARPFGSRHSDRRHDRGAVGGAHRRSAGAGSGLLQHRHQRSDSVLPRRRSHRRSGVAALRAAAPGDSPDDQAGGARGAPPPASRLPCAARWPPTRCC